MESDDSSSDENAQMDIIYTCRKCVGKEFTKEELDEHRTFHKNERKQRKRRRRGVSPTPSSVTTTGTLFISKPPPRRTKRKTAQRNSEQDRRASAQNNYTGHAKKNMNVKYNGA